MHRPTDQHDDSPFSSEPIAPQGESANESPSRPRINEQRARYVVIGCLDAGKTVNEIREKLMAYDYPEAEANQLIDNVMSEQRRTLAYDAAFRGSPWVHMISGSLIFLLGTGATLASFMAAEHGGAYVVLYWGAILGGAFQFYRGLSQWNHW